MKKLILLTLLIFVGVSLSAQDLPEIVYLKNGNLIRGEIIQIIPDKSLEIRSKDGKVYVYDMDEVLSIEKNAAAAPPRRYNDRRTSSGHYGRHAEEFSEPMYSSNEYSLHEGYRGMFDLGYSVSVDVAELNRLEFTTSHGYQFNPYLFLGVGGGVSFYHGNDSESTVSFPIFINPRIDFNTGKISPFIDLKGGYTLGEDVEGLYLSPSIGARCAITTGTAINFSMGYTLQQLEVPVLNEYGRKIDSSHPNIGAITIKIGFDF
ncbi:hypothetical protein [Dysgonomonas sp. HGC4]|uniref:hypothetical protein n=1 Tax=Dysgonomonas sp. HGC4 TaxID=1658009 RepID=UPI0006828B97|nr:hypothetical protein [Dysgonomonas sp. HGC4]MBD8349586.1 hypothetical protein [Dysgonomonas sp. HGC4]